MNKIFERLINLLRKKNTSVPTVVDYGYTSVSSASGYAYVTNCSTSVNGRPTYSVASPGYGNKECPLCGEKIDNLSGNPSNWGVPIPEKGESIMYCSGCVTKSVYRYKEELLRERRTKKLKRIIKD